MSSRLAIEGGVPIRSALLPYGRQSIDEEDVAAVTDALRSDWLTTGPRVGEFERAFAAVTGTAHAVAVSSGTAALHTALHALAIGPGDEVIVPAITFAASANAAVYLGATPVFADVDPDTLLLTVDEAKRKVTSRTRAIVAVDVAGQPCDYTRLLPWAHERDVSVVADACHAIGGAVGDRPVGSLADLSTFSLHPVKSMTTGEGGMITTDDARFAERARRFRNHGISTDHRQREAQGTWIYDMTELGYNYRLPDIACALGLTQLAKLSGWISRREAIARLYDRAFSSASSPVVPLVVRADITHGRHLYVVRIRRDRLRVDRGQVLAALRAEGIGVNVHYRPVYLHTFYRERFGLEPGLCPIAEQAYEQILSLPIFPRMSDRDAQDVIDAVTKVGEAYAA